MACKLERPDPQELFNRYRDMFSNTVLGGAPVVPESNEWYATAVNYAIGEQFYAISEQAWKERDPRTACCENLVDMAALDGIYPYPASFAQGYLKLTGTPGAALPSPLEFVIGDQTFITASKSSQPTAIGEDGTVVIRVRALIAGEGGNLQETEGTMSTKVPGVEATVVVCGGTFCQGSSAESCEVFRARYLKRRQYTPRSTNQWILDKLLEWPCATRAIQRAGSCCRCGEGHDGCEDCGCKDCGGDLAFYLMFDTSFPCGVAPVSLLREVQEWMFGSPQGYGLGQAEVGICGRVVPVNPVLVDVFIDIVGCPTVSQLEQIEATVREYMATAEPSMPIKTLALHAIVANILGIDIDVSARFAPVTDSDFYGGTYGPFIKGTSKVYAGSCDIEPDCDYIPCLNTLTITRPDTSGASC